MGFRELKDIKIAYNSDNDDTISEFFIPVLKESKSYKRVSAYYSSDSLKVLSEGLAAMLSNEGKVQMIVSLLENPNDFEAIKSAKANPALFLNKYFIKSEEELKNLMSDDNVAALAYLLSSGRLEMKFVISMSGIFHLKFGLFIDKNSDSIGFSGSMNETASGLRNNIEEFKVFRSWVPDETKYLQNDADKFDSYWNGEIKDKDIIVSDLPEETKNIIIKQFNLVKKGKFQTLQPLELNNIQMAALDSWLKNNRKGILEMATGTGKTRVGIYAILNLLNNCENENLIIVIGCPTKALAKQWRLELNKFNLSDTKIDIINSTIKKEELYKKIKSESTKKRVIIGTYSTIHNKYFTNEILPDFGSKLGLIADEAHWLGAPEFSKTLSDKFNYRLALTATPIRAFDIEGTDRILKYFGGIVYRYLLEQAIRDGVLTKYKYHIYFCNLNIQELGEYKRLSQIISRTRHVSKRDGFDINQVFLSKRARIIKKAKNKILVFKTILDELKLSKKLAHLVVYCEDNVQIKEYFPILKEVGAESRIINEDTSEEERDRIISEFDKGQIDCILAMKIFDEGIDVPSASRGIFISSTSNPKQFIQRRGRLLRKHIDKPFSEIYDIIIAPDPKYVDQTYADLESKIMLNELKRVLIFSKSAINAYDCYKQLEEVCEKYNINLWHILTEDLNGRN